MPQWMKDQAGTVSFVAGALAYAFTNFATAKYVDDKYQALEKRQDRVVETIGRKLDRFEDKLDRIYLKVK